MSTLETSPSSNGRAPESWARSWTHLRVDRPSLGHCRVTFEHPPTNTITATTVAELAEIVGLIEEDSDLNVVVFDSANTDHYLAGPAGMHAWLELLVRLSRAPVVSIASIRGRVRGAGSEFVQACDLRFASREAEQYGYVDRVIADDRLDAEVEAVASRLAHIDHGAIARAKKGQHAL
jgi:enoyl-CoA hydratase/carnithine racemase